MPKSHKARTRLLSTAAAMVLVGAMAGTAQAVETKFGEFSITFDTTVSMGASMKTADRETSFLPESNGGPVDPRENGVVLFSGNLPTFGGGFGGYTLTANPDNYDGSINTDDGRMNFDNGDLIGANVKANHDLLVKWQNYTLFARAVGFYDVVMNDAEAGERSIMTDQALGDVGRNYELLDLFVSADYTVLDMPLNVRVGKQVINWGESTFILGGNNIFNPIDVASFRRPGSEIKEALLPVNAVSASLTLPEDLMNISLSGYYALDWEPFEPDPAGTPFSTVDVAAFGGGLGSNQMYSFVTGTPFSGNRRNCVAAAGSGTRAVQTNGLLPDPLVAQAGILDCTDRALLPGTSDFGPMVNGGIINYNTPFATTRQEYARVLELDYLASEGMTPGANGLLRRGRDILPDDDGQFGLSARYVADWLDGTEFAGYYQHYASRLPTLSIGATGNPGQVAFFLNGDSNQSTVGGVGGRQLNPGGCGYDPATGGVTPVSAIAAGVISTGALSGGLSPAAIAFMKNTPVNDAGGILAAAQAAYNATFGLAGDDLYVNPNAAIGINNMYAIAQLNCALAFYQSGPNPVVGVTQSLNGAEFLIPAGDGQAYLEYADDIDAWGWSFNTTIGGWGVQGDFTYRPNAPFQVDTDSLTIASLINGCLFDALYGAGGGASVDPLGGPDGTGAKPFCGSGDLTAEGTLRNEMWTAQIGTTATFAQSEWFIDAVGADLGIFVTEIGVVYTPGVEDTWIDNLPAARQASVTQFQNIGCQGTDLVAGGIIGLDHKSSEQCRPTDWSAGFVLVYSLQYSNAFNTGFMVSPTIVYSYDFEGTTAAPYGNYLEDRQAVNLGVSGTLNNNFRVGVNYTNYFGGHIQNKARDQDFASISASYSF